MKKKYMIPEDMTAIQVFTCKAIIGPALKKSTKSSPASRPGKKKYGATEISTFPMVPLKKANGNKSKKK